MDELIKIITPQNFAMVVSIYLLVRFEKSFAEFKNSIEAQNDALVKAINKQSKLLAMLFAKVNLKPDSSKECKDAFDSMVRECYEEENTEKEDRAKIAA
jgi:hypothetical protein